MTLWIVYFVAFSQLVVLYGFFGPLCNRMFYGIIVHRNPQWVNENADFRRLYPPPKYSIWAFYLTGFAWFVFLVDKFFVAEVQFWIAASLTVPALPFLAIYLLYVGVEYFRVLKKVPLPAKRTTSLERRSLRDLLNPWWIYSSYLLLAIIGGAYLVAYDQGLIDRNIFSRRIIGLTVAASIATVILLLSLRRKKQPVDELIGRGYRKLEVASSAGTLYLTVLTGAWRLSQDVLSVRQFSDLYAFVALNVLVQLTALYLLLGLPFFPRRPLSDSSGSTEHLRALSK